MVNALTAGVRKTATWSIMLSFLTITRLMFSMAVRRIPA
jgi:hypothetical protein